MKKILGRIALVATASVMIGGLAACAGESAVPPTPTEGQTLSIQGVENIPGLDHWATNGVGQDTIGMLWGDMLVSSDHKGEYTAGLAESWEWADDNLSVTLALRDGVTFSDGSDFTSEDVKFTLERLKSPDLPNSGAWAASLDRVETPDDTTAVVYFSAPMPVFLNQASRTPILPSDAFQADPEGFFDAPIGTGPFTVTEYDGPTGTVSLDKNPDWWGWTDDNKTNVDHIDYAFSATDTSRASSLLADEIDIAQKVSVLDADRIEAAGADLIKYQESSHVYLGLRSGDGLAFADPKLREALSLAIDRGSIVTDLLGGGAEATWPAPPDTIGYKETDGYDHDVDQAKELVAESNYDGRTLNMIIPAGIFSQSEEVAQAIQSMAAEAGIDVAVQSLDVATFQEYQTAGNYDLYVSSFTLANGDSFTEITNLIGKDRFNTGYKNEELTALSQQVAKTVDLDERDALTQDAYQIVMDNFAPTLYLYEPQAITATAAGVEGLVAYPDGIADFRFVSKS